MSNYMNGMFLVVIFSLFGFSVYAHDNLFKFDALKEFKSHTIIRPQIHHGKHKRAIKSTLEELGLHASHITLSYHDNGEQIIADLHLNENLIPQGHFLRYQNSKNGGDIVQNFTKTEIDLCHYQGNIRGKSESRIAISTCNNGINGMVFDGTNTYFIHSGPDGEIHRDHYLLRHADMIKNATCGYHDDEIISDDNDDAITLNNIDEANILGGVNNNFNRMLRYKRSPAEIRGPYNANKYSSFVELVLVVDNKVYQSFNENMKKIHNHCKDLANIVNALYVPLNIFIALVGVVVWNESDEIALAEDGDTTLKNFLQYRRTKLVVSHPNDNAQLLTKVQFSGGVVGKALKGPICTFEYSGGVSMEHSSIVGVVATTVAHEMGHNFGMEHDTMDCKCEDEKCIMSASSTSVVPRHWSSCSKDQLNVAFSRGMNYCLRNKPTKLFDSPQCGNGFVEVGEQCDCGLPKYCQNTCCDPTTCMLYTNASCATGECCDLTTCRPKAAGIQCRSAQGECDLPEFCTGEAEYCPADVFKRDTIKCDNGEAYCYQGNCRSRSAQCKVLWGPSGQSSEYCYEKNTDGSRHGNCGFDRYNNRYMRCNESDVYCGMLHCRHLNERLEFGMESVAVLSHTFLNHKSHIIPCRTAIVDLGLESTDPGLTPNGAKCGTDKMCVNQKCVDVKQFRATGKSVECPENCNGNGICNSKGNCHCFVGFAPPFCSSPGPGGSHDSGPETNPNSNVGFVRAMYIFFLGVVPCFSIFLFLTYYYKQIKSTGLRKSTNVMKPTIKSNPPRGSGNSPSGGMPTSSPSSTDDMNSALLRSPAETDTSVMNNTMFGKFKGFTLRPLPNATTTTPVTPSAKQEGPKVAFVHPVSKPIQNSDDTSTGVPIRAAPPAPKTANGIALDNDIKKILQNGTLQHLKKTPPNTLGKNFKTNNGAPALPPPNPGFHARPLISNPVLETSTCTAKEIATQPTIKSDQISIPVRSAPTAPPVPAHADPSKFPPKKDGTIKRIASFLNKKDEKINIHPQKVKPSIDRARLKTIEISGPIPFVNNSTESDNQTERTSINRTQSMRSPSKKNPPVSITTTATTATNNRPNLQSFNSMRSPPGVNRPNSIVNSSARPKSPPPPRPPAPPTTYKVPGQPRKYIENQYDDCEAVEVPLTLGNTDDLCSNGDEIYSVIDERPPPPPVPSIATNNKAAVIKNSNARPTADDGMGLLGEIVNEIEKRNGDSIYSASTLRKKKSIDNSSSSTKYENTSDISPMDTGDVEYLKSNSSTSSGGYLRPSAINTPIARVAPSRPDASSSAKLTSGQMAATHSFSSFKPNSTQSEKGVNNASNKTSITPAENKKVPVFGRTKTPPSLNSSNSVRKRSPSPVNSSSTTSKNNTSIAGAKNSAVPKTKPLISPKMIRKNSQSDNKPNETTATTSGAKKPTTTLPQKPKPLSKPTVITSGPVNPTGSKLLSNIGRQNSNPTSSTADSKLRSTQSSITNRKPSIKNDDSPAGAVATGSNNSKIMNTTGVRLLPGKVSAVASLQQKFENNNSNGTNKTNNTSSSNGLVGKKF